MRPLLAVYLREMLLLRRRFWRVCLGMSVSPVLYVIAFGYALGAGSPVGGLRYLDFLIPGLVAMSSMTQAYGVSSEINIARFYAHIFEEFQAAPLTNLSFVTGEVMAGITRAGLSTVLIVAIGAAFGVTMHCGPLFWVAVVLNAFVFASLAVWSAMVVKSHADQALLANFVITPMAFLGGTFFPLERLPGWSQRILDLVPLTHAARAIRAEALGGAAAASDYALLVVLGAAAFFIALRSVDAARE
ncbi:MAG: ABC transporter [Telmatospirillum sp.]|nr:ABC transporter [Telmatospirillum sp.]